MIAALIRLYGEMLHDAVFNDDSFIRFAARFGILCGMIGVAAIGYSLTILWRLFA